MDRRFKVLIGAMIFALSVACGPKMASKETMQRIQELQAQIEKLQSEIAKCEEEMRNIDAQKTEKSQLIEKLRAERDSLKTLLELIKQGY
ncbi:MAG: hypothetical protein ABIM98_06565 [candidate division WOR-3 bacterium]